MAQPQRETAAPAPPAATRPRRRRVLAAARRRPLLSFVLLLLACVAGMRLWWGWYTGRQLAAQQAQIRARGEPVEPAEFVRDPLPPAENALVVLTRAAALDPGMSPANSSLEYAPYPPFGAAWEGAAAVSESRNAAVFPLARRARALPRAQLNASYASPMFATLLPALNTSRKLANTLGDGALYQHLVAGNDAEAVERLRDVLHLARSLHQDDCQVSQLVAIGITALAVDRTQVIAPGLGADVPATRRSIEGLIAELLDDRPSREGLRRALVFERVALADAMAWQSEGTWAIRPLAQREMVRTNADAAVFTAAAEQPNAAAAARVLATLPPRRDEPKRPFGGPLRDETQAPRYSRWFSTGRWAGDRFIAMHYRLVADRRAAAVSLAAQLYRADHGGRWPQRLEELVPRYLPALPLDPYFDDGRPLGYVVKRGAPPGGSDRPLVYFDPLEDNDAFPGGVVHDESAIDAEPMYGWHHDPRDRIPRVIVRQYRDLARWSPVSRRFDVMMREQEEAEREAREEEERARRELGLDGEGEESSDGGEPASPDESTDDPSGDSPEAVDDDPGEPDAPGDDAEEQDQSQN